MNKTTTPSRVTEHSEEKFRALSGLVGNTPLLGIHFEYRGSPRVIYAKCEQFNMTGSIKDRMALHILKTAYADELIKPGDTIAEATSGNTGIAFAAIGRALGHSIKIFMPDWMSRERKGLIQSYGAEIVSVSEEQGGFLGSLKMAEQFATTRTDVFLPRQFANYANVEAHEKTTGPEIMFQLEAAGLRPDSFVAGVGTGGTVMGVGRFLRAQNPKIKIHPVEPAESPTLSTGHRVGKHRIQGISDEFIPAILDLDALDEVIAISDGDSILMAQKLVSTLGLAVGISSGCNFLAAAKIQEDLGGDSVVATVFPDDNRKYLSTALMCHEISLHDYLTPEIRLQKFSAFPRACMPPE